MHHPTDRIRHTTAFVTPVVDHWLEREIAQWVHHEGSIQQLIAPWLGYGSFYEYNGGEQVLLKFDILFLWGYPVLGSASLVKCIRTAHQTKPV